METSSRQDRLRKIYVNPLTFQEKKNFFYAHSQAIMDTHTADNSKTFRNVLEGGASSSTKEESKRKKDRSTSKFIPKLKQAISDEAQVLKFFGRSYFLPKMGKVSKEAQLLHKVGTSRIHETARSLENLVDKTHETLTDFLSSSIGLAQTSIENRVKTNRLAKIKPRKPRISDETDVLSKNVKKIEDPFVKKTKYRKIGKYKILKVPKKMKHDQKRKTKWDVPNYVHIREILSDKHTDMRMLSLSERLSKSPRNKTDGCLERMHLNQVKICKKIKNIKKEFSKKSKFVDPRSAIY